jgi:RNA polymerase sigma factor (sigma-70 family)
MTDLFDSIWRRVFREAATLSQEEVLVVFDQMDAVLERAIRLIGRSPIVLDSIMNLTADVAGSLSHGRGIFVRGAAIEKIPKEQKEERPPNAGMVWDTDPGQTFRYRNLPDSDAIEFMGSSLRLFALWGTDSMRSTDVWSVRLSRASHEAIIEEFLRRAGTYNELCTDSAKLRIRYMRASGPRKACRIFSKVSNVSDRMFAIENELGFHDGLFGVLRDLRAIWSEYQKLRDKIYVPYLRIVLDEAKRRATSEIQTIENFQNGAIGLMAAISNYNRRRGVFSSYARMWATQGILLKLKEEANPIKLPAAVWQTANRLNEIAQRHAAESSDGSFDMEAVAKEAGIDARRAEKIFERIRSTQMLSIDYKTSDDPDAQSLHETVEDERDDEIPEINQFLDVLSERQRLYVMLNFGLFDQLPGQVPSDPVVLARERLYQTVAFSVTNQPTT